MKKVFILVFLFIMGSVTFSQWEWSNPIPSGVTFNDIKFTSSTTGFIAGNAGTILKTTDAGTTWQRTTLSTSANIYKLYFLNTSVGFASGSNGTVLRTTNGGADWGLISLSQADNLYAVFCTDAEHIAVAGFSSDQLDVLAYSTDGGISWIRGTFSAAGGLYDFASADASTHFLTGYTKVFKSTSGVSGFTAQPALPTGSLARAITFTDVNSGYIASQQRIYKTINSGSTWSSTDLTGGIQFTGLSFPSATLGFASGYDLSTTPGKVYKTTNAGATWVTTGFSSAQKVNKVAFLNSVSGFIVGTGGLLMKTSDAGSTWSNVYNSNVHADIQDIVFPSTSVGYAAGLVNAAGSLYKTTDGGTSWVTQNTILNASHYSVSFPNTATGFVSVTVPGVLSAIYKTTNGGANWNQLGSTSTLLLRALAFATPTIGIAAPFGTNVNKVFKTTDGGDTWVQKTCPLYSIYSIYAKDSLTFFATGATNSGNTGTVCRSIDGGESWQRASTLFANTKINNVSFVDGQNGFAVGEGTTGSLNGFSFACKTTDGGVSWNEMYVQPLFGRAGALNDVYFFDAAKGFVAGKSGKNGFALHYTSDAGQSWTPVTSTDNDLYSISFPSLATGFTAGTNGNILKTTTGGITSMKTENSATPTEYIITANYPNPFNPSTTVWVSMPEEMNVSLKVYTVTGKEVTSLYTGRLHKGAHHFTFNASNLGSGMYIYRLHTGNKTISGKMVLLK